MKKFNFMLAKRIFAGALLSIAALPSIAQNLDPNVPTGFAIMDTSGIQTTTGGANGKVVTAKTVDDMIKYCGSDEPLIIMVEGTLNASVPYSVKSNKTIIGKDANAKLNGAGLVMKNVSNIIVRNLAITGSVDGIGAHHTDHLWIDHCDIYDNSDGLLDITNQSSYCTVSWCKFYYVNQTKHKLACLIGSGGGDHPEDWNYLRVTYHHNWYGNNVKERMPRVMYGLGHVFNDYYTCTGNDYCVGVGSYGAALVENNYFKNVQSPQFFMYDVYCWMTARGNQYDNVTGKQANGKSGTKDVKVKGWAFPVVEFPEAPYLYAMDKAADVPNLVGEGASVHAAFGQIGLMPAPGQGAMNVNIAPTLTWAKGTAGRDATSYKVYFGTTATPPLVATVTEQNYHPGKLNVGTVYYWRVDMVTPSGTIAGKTWEFKTNGGML